MVKRPQLAEHSIRGLKNPAIFGSFLWLYIRTYNMCILYSNILGRQENTYNTEEKKPVKLW